MAATCRVVIFDLDDTLWDLVRTMQRAHEEWAAAVRMLSGGRELAEAHPDWRSWTDASKAFADIKRDRPDLGKDLTLIRREAMKLACEAHGLDPQVLVDPGYEAWTAARNRPVFFDGATALLSDLKAQGVVVGVISDGFADLEKMPEVASFVDFAVFAKDVGVSKPDAKIFQIGAAKAAEHLKGTCSAADCVMVGDSYQKDVLGAQSAGMRTVWFDNPGSFPRAECGQVPVPPFYRSRSLVSLCLCDASPWQLPPPSPRACDRRIRRFSELAAVLSEWAPPPPAQ